MQNNYVVYHLHSDLSNGVTNIDSVTKFPEYIAKAKELGMTALAFSEHGSVFSWYDKKEQIEAAGMKYIHAEEFYITAEVSPEKRLRDNWHCVLIAKNFDGVREINRLASKSFNRADGHYYYVPRISFDDLLSVSENIIITSACLGGILNRGDEEHQLAFLKYMSQHNDRCFLEIQHHNVKDQIEYNKRLVLLSREYNIPLIAGTDTHSLNAEHAKGRVVLQKAKDIRFDNEEGWDLTFKTYDELCAAYAVQNSVPQEVYLEAIENTNKMANMVETFEMDRHTKYPHIYDNPEETFKQKINEAFRNHPYARKRYTSKEIAPIIKEEFDVYKKVGAIDFMLLETYIREWERKNDIQSGYGRGSVSGSMIAYLLGITQMDSIKFGLNFFRFMNPSRVSNADIDTDYCGKDRDRIKYFILHDKLDLPNIKTSEIITFNTIATKGAIKDVGRAMDMSLEDTQALSDSVDIDGKVPENIRKKYPELFEYVDIVSGTIVSIGSHPSGVLVSDRDIESDVGLCSLSTSDYPVSMLDMHALDTLMYVKLDILGLDNIGVINDTCKLLGIDRLTPDSVDLQDEAVWDDIKEDTTLIFQWESDSAKAYLDKFMSKETIEKAKQYNKDFSYIKWFSFGNGLIRPGCASFRNEVAEAKALVTGFKEFDEFLAPTLGRITMQEDIMRFCKQFCGYSDAESDNVRRCVDENTLIMMGDGTYKPIKDVRIGEYVMSFNEATGCNEPQLVTNVFDNGVQETVHITTKNYASLIATPSHKVYVGNAFKQVSQLDGNDLLYTPSNMHCLSDSKRPNQRLSQTDMYMLGLLIGDGTIGLGRDIVFTNHEHALIDAYKQCVEKHLRNTTPPEFTIAAQNGVSVDKVYAVHIKSQNYRESIYNFLRRYDLCKKAADKHIPFELLRYPADAKLANLLAGMFNTDGGSACGGYKWIDYSTTSEHLIHDLQYALLKYGITSNINASRVDGYPDMISYRLYIRSPLALQRFRDHILPFMVGEKMHAFERNIETVCNSNAYNFMLPRYCKDEIVTASKSTQKGVSAAYTNWHNVYDTITDICARQIVDQFYLPQTYRLLHSEISPIYIDEITPCGESHVYDIEVANNHNYYANGILVHNCIAKKKGTEGLLGELHDRFLSYSHETYGVDEALLEKIFPPIKQGILDASDYAFSWNHSDAYSCIGYISGYLRHYHPLEFLTAAFNIFYDNTEKIADITRYTNKVGIKIMPIKFRHSRAEYSMDKANNAIYSGMRFIKYMNVDVAEKLYAMKDQHFNSFVDLVKVFPGDRRQLDILIKLGYFSEFGKSKKLLDIVYIYDKYGTKKIIKRGETMLDEKLLNKYAISVTPKQYKFDADSMTNLISELTQNLQDKSISLASRIRAELEYLGYIQTRIPDMEGYGVVCALKSRGQNFAVTIADIATGEINTVKMKHKLYENEPIAEWDIIGYKLGEEYPWTKNEDGKWVQDTNKQKQKVLAWCGVSQIYQP